MPGEGTKPTRGEGGPHRPLGVAPIPFPPLSVESLQPFIAEMEAGSRGRHKVEILRKTKYEGNLRSRR
jgi:hypothetical protein